jgi:hypothetical protein
MFRAWKDTILSHYSLLSGKGLKNEKPIFFDDLSHHHSKLFPCPLQPRRRPTVEKFWAIERGRLRPFVLRSGLRPKTAVSTHPERALIIGSVLPVCQTN